MKKIILILIFSFLALELPAQITSPNPNNAKADSLTANYLELNGKLLKSNIFYGLDSFTVDNDMITKLYTTVTTNQRLISLRGLIGYYGSDSLLRANNALVYAFPNLIGTEGTVINYGNTYISSGTGLYGRIYNPPVYSNNYIDTAFGIHSTVETDNANNIKTSYLFHGINVMNGSTDKYGIYIDAGKNYLGGQLQVQNILPIAHNTYTLGTPTLVWDKTYSNVYKTSVFTVSGTTLNCDTSNSFTKILDANVTLDLANISDGQVLNITTMNDSTYTVAWTATGLTIKWSGGTPIASTGTFALRKTDLWSFTRQGSFVYGSVVKGY